MMQAWKAAATRHQAELWQMLAIVLATLLSYVIAFWLNLAEPFWSVITAAIVARITARGAVRAALIAGIIVFSAAAHLASPFAPALARIMEVGLGAIVAALVSIILGAVFRPPEPKEP